MQINANNLQRKVAKMQSHQDWNDFNFFLTVAMQGSLSKAAEKLGVNHSTVFRRINALEDKMGVRLFERLKKGYQLTQAGAEVLESAKSMEEHAHAIQRKLIGKDIQLSGTLKISTTDTIGYYWLPPYVRTFQIQVPPTLSWTSISEPGIPTLPKGRLTLSFRLSTSNPITWSDENWSP